MAGGPEHDETPGKAASLIVNLVDSCLVGIYLQSALRGVSPIPPKAARANKQGGSPAAAQADKHWLRDGDVVYDTKNWKYGAAVSCADILGAVKADWEKKPVGTIDASSLKQPAKVNPPAFQVNVEDDLSGPEGLSRDISAEGRPPPKATCTTTLPAEERQTAEETLARENALDAVAKARP